MYVFLSHFIYLRYLFLRFKMNLWWRKEIYLNRNWIEKSKYITLYVCVRNITCGRMLGSIMRISTADWQVLSFCEMLSQIIVHFVGYYAVTGTVMPILTLVRQWCYLPIRFCCRYFETVFCNLLMMFTSKLVNSQQGDANNIYLGCGDGYLLR